MDAKTDFPVWSERYDRELADVLEVQDAIARKIAQALRVTLSPQEQEELRVRQAIGRKASCEGACYLLGRALFAASRYQEVAEMAESAVEAARDDCSVYVPIINALGALGKDDARASFTQRRVQSHETHVLKVPEDARARVLLASSYAEMGRAEESIGQMEFARAPRPNDSSVQGRSPGTDAVARVRLLFS